MVTVMEPPQTVRPQTPPEPLEPAANQTEKLQVMIDVREVDFAYGDNKVLHNISLQMAARAVTAFIGPSGCGKTTLLRCINRMNDLIDGSGISKGAIRIDGVDINSPGLDVVDLRRRVGMVFQKSNPFPKSIYENIAYGLRVAGVKKHSRIGEAVEKSLRSAALWDEVKDRLETNAYGLSGGQQQRLCIARALAVGPEVVLMDEPCSALDPIATAKIEELIQALKTQYTIVIVTHNMDSHLLRSLRRTGRRNWSGALFKKWRRQKTFTIATSQLFCEALSANRVRRSLLRGRSDWVGQNFPV